MKSVTNLVLGVITLVRLLFDLETNKDWLQMSTHLLQLYLRMKTLKFLGWIIQT